MGAHTLEQALKRAAIMRQLRDVEMGEARRWREMRDALSDPGNDFARATADRHVGLYVAAARKWNRQLVIASRSLRHAMFSRVVGRPFVRPVPRQAVRP